MNISDEELRALVRAAVARARQGSQPDDLPPSRSHISHLRLGLVSGGDADGQCLIEPAVRCNHCGYCQSHGH